MKANIDATYAQIVNKQCHWIFTSKELPEWNEDDIQAVEITGQEVKVGYDFKDGIFTAPLEVSESVESLSIRMRSLRNSLIQKTDWTQFSDIDKEITNKWIPYRQALRDITLQDNFPIDITWPVEPA